MGRKNKALKISGNVSYLNSSLRWIDDKKINIHIERKKVAQKQCKSMQAIPTVGGTKTFKTNKW